MLDRLHARLVRSRLLQRFTAFTRVLLAVGFIPPGLKKLTGEPFTQLPVSHPVGYFFDAFFQATEFYVFVGLAQVVAALLLLWPRTATLGAVLYFPIILNIAVVTVAIGFQGTWLITILMTLACLWLLVWDYDRLKAILPSRRAGGAGVQRARICAPGRASGLGRASRRQRWRPPSTSRTSRASSRWPEASPWPAPSSGSSWRGTSASCRRQRTPPLGSLWRGRPPEAPTDAP